MIRPIKFESELLEIKDLTKDVKHFVFFTNNALSILKVESIL